MVPEQQANQCSPRGVTVNVFDSQHLLSKQLEIAIDGFDLMEQIFELDLGADEDDSIYTESSDDDNFDGSIRYDNYDNEDVDYDDFHQLPKVSFSNQGLLDRSHNGFDKLSASENTYDSLADAKRRGIGSAQTLNQRLQKGRLNAQNPKVEVLMEGDESPDYSITLK